MFGDMGKMMKQAKKMQEDMMKAQEELANMVVEGTSGGEAVKVKVNGEKIVVSIEIKKEAVDPDEIEMLQDLILAATNNALKEIDEITQKKMGNLTGGLGFPGMM